MTSIRSGAYGPTGLELRGKQSLPGGPAYRQGWNALCADIDQALDFGGGCAVLQELAGVGCHVKVLVIYNCRGYVLWFAV